MTEDEGTQFKSLFSDLEPTHLPETSPTPRPHRQSSVSLAVAHLLSGGRDPVGPRQGLPGVGCLACPPGGTLRPGPGGLGLAFPLQLQVPPPEELLLPCPLELLSLLGPECLPHLAAASGHVGAAAAALTGLLPALILGLVALSPPALAGGKPGVWADHDDLLSTCCAWLPVPGIAAWVCQMPGGRGKGGVRRWAEK